MTDKKERGLNLSEQTPQMRITPVILCGGSGTRLWPASRESMPKQFIQLFGKLSTFQLAAKRVADPEIFNPPIVACHQDARFTAAQQLSEIGIEADLLLEPERRDSATAIACATLVAASRSADDVLLVLPADHVIADEGAFTAACLRAARSARAGRLMTFGTVPTSPATQFGYVLPGEPLDGGDGFATAAFVEKPDEEEAGRLVAQGYLWNSGYFLFRPDVMVRELELHAPTVLAAARTAVAKANRDLDFIRLDPEGFRTAPSVSIDIAVMETSRCSGVLEVAFGWSDLGTWSGLWNALPHDEAGNALAGDVVVQDTRDSLVRSDGILTTVVGLDNVVVVAKSDAVLVTTRDNSHQVRELVSDLKSAGREEAAQHPRVDRPWGWYQRADLGQRFQVKRIMVRPGGQLSLQRHFHRAEHWVVVRGTAEVTVNEHVALLHENDGICIPIGAVHRLHNPGLIDLQLIEVQVGSYTGEDDIVRLEDVYGRSPPAPAR